MAILQAAMFALGASSPARVVSLAGGALALLTPVLRIGSNNFGWKALWAVTVVLCANVAWSAMGSEPYDHPLLRSGVVLGYSGIVLAGLLALLRVRVDNALLLAMSLALALWGGEAAVRRYANLAGQGGGDGVRWVGAIGSDPNLGDVYYPRSALKTLYPSNPRHYFDEPDAEASFWVLDSHDPGSEGVMTSPYGKNKTMRVEIKRADKPVYWHLQLREPGVSVQAGEHELEVEARADAPRKITAGVSMGHDPWSNIGLFQEINLATEFRQYKYRFSTTQADKNAQVHLDIGAETAPVEIRRVTLRRVSDGAVPEPVIPKEYSVTYSFNDLGCRGRDYPVPRPAEHYRILALGDSFTLGVGVHQADTFESKLEQSLNGSRNPADRRIFEVINCGVSGYSTREERLTYEGKGVQYQPQVVLLVMVENDERSWREDVKKGYFHAPTGAENKFAIWRMVQTARHEGTRPPADFHPNIGEILELQADVQKNQARLAVVFFRHVPLEGNWKTLVETISSGLNGKGIPMIDLGVEMLNEHDPKTLMVYPPIDGHPNEIAHANAAKQIEAFLRREGLVQ